MNIFAKKFKGFSLQFLNDVNKSLLFINNFVYEQIIKKYCLQIKFEVIFFCLLSD